MIEFISVAEFHETEGSKITMSYPGISKEIVSALSGYILPEGLHKFSEDSDLILIRTPKLFESPEDHPK